MRHLMSAAALLLALGPAGVLVVAGDLQVVEPPGDGADPQPDESKHDRQAALHRALRALRISLAKSI